MLLKLLILNLCALNLILNVYLLIILHEFVPLQIIYFLLMLQIKITFNLRP